MIASSNPKIRYQKGYKYQLKRSEWFHVGIPGNHSRIESENIHDPWIRLRKDGVLEIRAGYAWDGASGPTFDTKSTFRASLVHDALYQLMRAGKLSQNDRDEADKALFLLLVQDGCWEWRAKLWLATVRKFAGYAAKRQNEPILEAP